MAIALRYSFRCECTSYAFFNGPFIVIGELEIKPRLVYNASAEEGSLVRSLATRLFFGLHDF